jgi:flagella basal body P-ring formation protein FlgA
MRRLVLLALLATLPARAEQLATVRPIAVVEDGMVRLSYLFEKAGPRGGVVLGPAPAPGTRWVVEAPQLLAIARANGLAWRPLGGAERVVLERPGRMVAREEVLLALRAALRPQGLEEDDEIELQAFSPPLVPERAFVQLAIESALLDAMGARFVATLAIAAEGMPTQRLRLAGRVVETAPMLVAARRLALGEVLRAQDVREVRVPASRLRPGAAQDISQVVGQALRRPASAQQPLLVSDLTQPVAVERGQTVTMHYEVPGMALTAQGRAMESAPRGGSVPVMNLASRVVVEAQVIAPGRVRVGALR